MKIDRSQFIDLCRRHGAAITAKPFDGPTLMYAIAADESGDGINCAPRHEDGYCRGGRHYDPAATREWNCLAHMSFGPWQLMWVNCQKVSPLILLTDTETMAALSAKFIQSVASRVNVLDINAALAVLAHLYNGPAVTQEYIERLTCAYAKGLPE